MKHLGLVLILYAIYKGISCFSGDLVVGLNSDLVKASSEFQWNNTLSLSACGENTIWYILGPCELSCAQQNSSGLLGGILPTLNLPSLNLTSLCFNKCMCILGYYRRSDGNCVLPELCSVTTTIHP